MKVRKPLSLLLIFAVACVTPGIAQIYWSKQSPVGITDDICCVTYANGTFAAVTNEGNLLTSTDGLAWSSRTVDQGVSLESIAYGNGTWVVVGDNGTILVSTDLEIWVTATSGTTNRLNGVLYIGYLYVAVGDNGTILTSPDTQTWTSWTSGVTGSLRGIALLPVGLTGPGDPFKYEIFVSGENGVLLSALSSGVIDPVYMGFAAVPSATTQDLEAILPQGVAVGENGAIIRQGGSLVSPSWLSATTAVPSTTATFRGLTYGNGFYVAAGDQGTIYTSADTINWTQRFSGDGPSTLSTAMLLSATYSEPLQRFVVAGTSGTILVSNTAPTALVNVSTRGYVSGTQTFIGGFVIAGTTPRTVLIRGDGPVLSKFSVPNPLPDPILTVYDNNGAVIATNTGWATNSIPSSISAAAQQVGAFALPNPSLDSALLLTLQPGAYTAQITSAKGNSGIALFEAYTD